MTEQFVAARPAVGALVPSRGAELGAPALPQGLWGQRGLGAGADGTRRAPPHSARPLTAGVGRAAVSARLDMQDLIVNKVSFLYAFRIKSLLTGVLVLCVGT